jgi:sec-independent protein translocase protein TatB
MFDFAWSEIALIAAVALIAIGPKDMPAAIRAVTGMVKKARKMAAEFQTHVDEMVREVNLDEVRSQFNEIRNFDVRGAIERAVDSDGSLRSTFASNPLEPTIVPPAPMEEITVAEAPADVVIGPPELHEPPAPIAPPEPRAPAFIPPGMIPPEVRQAAEPEPPPFIPPAFVQAGAARQRRPSP